MITSGLLAPEDVERLLPVRRHEDKKPRRFQIPAQSLDQILIIISDEDTGGHNSYSCSYSTATQLARLREYLRPTPLLLYQVNIAANHNTVVIVTDKGKNWEDRR